MRVKTGQKVVLSFDYNATIYTVKSTNKHASELVHTKGPHQISSGFHENHTLRNPSAEQIKYAKALGQY